MELQSKKSLLLDRENRPRPALISLLDLFTIHCDHTLPAIIQATQARWRQADKERWLMEPREEEFKVAALPLLKELGFISTVLASKMHYLYAIVLGGFVPRMQRRIDLLIDEWQRGVRFDHLVILTGKRPLDPVHEPEFAHLQTESKVLAHMCEQLPQEILSLPCTFIDSDMQQDARGNVRRPNTVDTIVDWFKYTPRPGDCLGLADQPFVNYFDAVFHTHLPAKFTLEVIGYEVEPDLLMGMLLDNLTRCLYQEQKFLEKN